MKNNQRKIGAILSYVSIFASTLVGLLYTPFLISKLGQSEYGLYSLVSSIIGYLTVLDLGFGNAIVVFTAKYREKKEYEKEQKLHGMFLIVYYIIGLIAVLLGLVLFFNTNNLFGKTMNSIEISKMKIMMLILTFNLVVTFSFSIYSSIINAYEKFVFQKVMSILNTVLKPIFMIPLLFLGYKSVTMCVVITLINIIILFSNYLYCKNKLNVRIKYSGFDKILFKTVIGYSIWIFLGVIVDKINWSVDQFVLGAVSGTIAVSIYSVAAQINTLFINLSTAISGVLLPKISKMVANNATSAELTNEMIKVGRIQFYIIFLMTSGLVLFGKEFILWWVGKEYIDSYYCVLLLVIPTSIPLIQNLGISIRQALNKHKFATIVNMLVAIINLSISIFLAKAYGPIGSSLGTAIGIIISIIIINYYYYYVLNLDMIKFWKNIFIMIFKNIVTIGFILFVMKYIFLQGIFSVIVYGCIYVILFCIINYFIVMNDYEKNIIKNILRR